MRRLDFRIRVNDICQTCQKPRYELSKVRREFKENLEIEYDSYHKGTYVDYWVGVELCRRYGLTDLEMGLRTSKHIPQELVRKPEIPKLDISNPELPEFIEITDFPHPVMVRRSDFRVNANHITQLAGRSRMDVASLRRSLDSEDYEILRGSTKHQGTYVNFDIGLELCRKYGLPELEKRFYSLKRTLEGPVLDAEPSRIRHRSQTFERLPESFGSDAVLAQKESTNRLSVLASTI